jgi:GT2 family glycosyltransferase
VTPRISVVIPTYRQDKLLVRCVRSVLDQRDSAVEVIVVDNGSRVDVAGLVAGIGDRRVSVVRLERNVFFCRAVNAGIARSRAPVVATLNDDAWVDPGWAGSVGAAFESAGDIGSVASLVVSESNAGIVDSAGNDVDLSGRAANAFWGRPVEEVGASGEVFGPSSCCAAYRRSALDRVGVLDDRFTAYFEDVDLAFRLRLAGYRSVLNVDSTATHRGGATQRNRHQRAYLIERNRLRTLIKNLPYPLFRRHRGRILPDIIRPTRLHDGFAPGPFLAGRTVAVAGLAALLRERRRIQSTATVDPASIEQILTSREVHACRL